MFRGFEIYCLQDLYRQDIIFIHVHTIWDQFLIHHTKQFNDTIIIVKIDLDNLTLNLINFSNYLSKEAKLNIKY